MRSWEKRWSIALQRGKSRQGRSLEGRLCLQALEAWPASPALGTLARRSTLASHKKQCYFFHQVVELTHGLQASDGSADCRRQIETETGESRRSWSAIGNAQHDKRSFSRASADSPLALNVAGSRRMKNDLTYI